MIFNLELVIMPRPMDFHDPDPDPGPPIFGRGPGSTPEEEVEGLFCSCGHPIGTQQGQCPFLADDAGRVTLTPWEAPDPLPVAKEGGIELVTTVVLWLLLLFGAIALGILFRYVVTG